MIDWEVVRWSDDCKRNLRAFDLADPVRVIERGERNLAGYGSLGTPLDDVWKIMINGPDAIFVKRHLGRSEYHDEVFLADEHVLRTFMKILDRATGSHRKL